MSATSFKPLRWRRGAAPGNGVLGAAIKIDGVWWAFYDRGVKNGWRSVKLSADMIRGRANYWLGWHTKQNRWAHWPDAKALATNHPELALIAANEMTGWEADGEYRRAGIIVSDYDAEGVLDSSACIPLSALPKRHILVSQLKLSELLKAHALSPYGGNDKGLAKGNREPPSTRGVPPYYQTRGPQAGGGEPSSPSTPVVDADMNDIGDLL